MHKTTERRIKHCEKCKSTGKIRVGNLREMHNSDIESCPYCFGDGSFIMETTTEIFRKTDDLVQSLIPIG
jgi:DnaJ-class molecular chaperone